MYCEELHLESGTVFKLLALTDKIEAASVREQCLRFLYTCLSLDTACDILEIAHHYNDMDLTEASMLFIRKQVKDVLQSAGRKNLCRECLDKVCLLPAQFGAMQSTLHFYFYIFFPS